MKYKIPIIRNDHEKLLFLGKLFKRGFVLKELRLRTVDQVMNYWPLYRRNEWSYILIGYYDDCSMQITPSVFDWPGLRDFPSIGADAFLKMVDGL